VVLRTGVSSRPRGDALGGQQPFLQALPLVLSDDAALHEGGQDVVEVEWVAGPVRQCFVMDVQFAEPVFGAAGHRVAAVAGLLAVRLPPARNAASRRERCVPAPEHRW
jgi:hypothetical protein